MKALKIALAICMAACSAAASADTAELSARDVMQKYDHVVRKSFESFISHMKLSTCKYKAEQERMRCAEKPRVAITEGVRKIFTSNPNDFQSYTNVIEPISDKGIGLLYYEYYDSGKDNDSWIYLPALNKVKRIITSNEDSDDSGSFLGTEFTTEDMQFKKIDDYTYKMLGEETYDDRPAWIIELTPTPKKMNRTKYGRIVAWIDKERHNLLKENLYNHRGELYKQHTLKNIERIDNVWVAKKVVMNNLLNRRVTIIDILAIAYNMEIPDEFFTQRTFTDFAWRERNMAELRKYWK